MPTGSTLVLLHGAGHTAAVWRETQRVLRTPSLAVDLPGRGRRPADLTRVTVAEAAASVAADVEEEVDGDVVLVAHSVAGTVAPSVAAILGDRVRHLVLVAGITGPDGRPPLEQFLPGQADVVAARLEELRAEHGGRTLEEIGTKAGASIDSLNLSAQPMSWAGVPDAMGRTFVRCLRDPIQPRDLQARFIASCRADLVVDIESGHTPALDAPAELAALLDAVRRAAALDRRQG